MKSLPVKSSKTLLAAHSWKSAFCGKTLIISGVSFEEIRVFKTLPGSGTETTLTLISLFSFSKSLAISLVIANVSFF
jgi:hypothetical protein